MRLTPKLAVLAGCWCAYAAGPARTTVADTIKDALGSRVSGTLRIQAAAAFAAPDGTRVDTNSQQAVTLVNGAFSVGLWPGAYTAKWQLTNGAPRTENWLVPATSATLRVADVITGVPPAPNATIPWQQMAQNGAAPGQAPVWNGSSWVPESIAVAGGSWGVVNQVACAASPVFDFDLGNIQQITLSCDVAASSVAHLPVGQPVMFAVCQDGTGGHGFAWPGAVNSGVIVGAAAGKCSSQWFYSVDGVHLIAQGIGVINQ